jgi:hypothetical protein
MMRGLGSKIYLVTGLFVLALYAIGESRGWVYFEDDQRAPLPTSVRASPGGYRSHGFWYSGYQGGK